MFNPITIPYGAKMLFNVVQLKPEYTIEDAEVVIGEMCNVVKNTYKGNGFIAGQVFKYSGFVSPQGTLGVIEEEKDHIVILTYWESFKKHEESHADCPFKEKFTALENMCSKTYEIGYDMLWQGDE